MLLIARTTEILPQEERDLRDLISAHPRTAPRPTDQPSGELTGSALDAFTAPCLLDETDEDSSFLPIRDSFPNKPSLAHPRAFTGESTMYIKQFHRGGCLIHLFIPDLALLALVLRHTTSNGSLQNLTPLIPTTLDSLASAFETGTLIALQQTGHLQLAADTPLTAEQVQAWCQRIVAGDVPERVTPTYNTVTTDSETSPEG